MNKISILLLLAAMIGCGNSPAPDARNVTAQNDSATGGGKAPAVSPMPAASPTLDPAKKVVVVKFPKGATEASYTDSFSGYGLVEYELVASADQHMTVEITRSDDDRASFTIMRNDLPIADDAGEVTGWTGLLPENSKYTISVGQVRAFARRDSKPVKFTIRIQIV